VECATELAAIAVVPMVLIIKISRLKRTIDELRVVLSPGDDYEDSLSGDYGRE
jgi:hypothetical protein